MSQITDFAAAEGVKLDAIEASLKKIVDGVKALHDLIVQFQNSPGTLSAADQAALDAIQAKSALVVADAAAIDTTVPAPPAPTAGPA